MRFAGQLVKSGKWYAAEVPLLGIDTQGKSKANAYAMVKDAIENLVVLCALMAGAFAKPGLQAVQAHIDCLSALSEGRPLPMGKEAAIQLGIVGKDALDLAIRLEKNASIAYMGLAMLLGANRDYEAALEHVRRGLEAVEASLASFHLSCIDAVRRGGEESAAMAGEFKRLAAVFEEEIQNGNTKPMRW